MRVKELETSVEESMTTNSWPRLTLIFLATPLLWLLLGNWFGDQIVLGWLAVASAYVLTLLVGANSRPPKSDPHSRSEVARALLTWLSPSFWSGILATVYLFVYIFIFDRGNFFPR